jgi:hypothetical protein
MYVYIYKYITVELLFSSLFWGIPIYIYIYIYTPSSALALLWKPYEAMAHLKMINMMAYLSKLSFSMATLNYPTVYCVHIVTAKKTEETRKD